MFYEYFGVYASKQPQSKNINDLKAGDIVRYHPTGYNNDHSIWITAVSGDNVTYADCNVSGPCKIRWNCKTTKSVIKQSLIHIKQAPSYSVKITSEIPVLYVSQTNTFLYSVSSNLSKSDVKWKAEPGSVLEINNKGDIKGKKAGTATVTAYVMDQNGNVLCSDSKKVTVKNPTITLDKESVTVYGNETVQLQATVNGPSQNVTWKSSSALNNKVTGNGTKATVSQGPTDILKSTTTTITATANGVSATCKVIRIPSTFDFINKNISIDAGSSSLLSMIKKGTGTLNFSSSNKTILTVTATSGQIKGIKAGKVYVTAVSGKIKKQCTVTVKPVVKLNKTDVTLQKGKTLLLNSKVIGTKNKVKWSSSNKSVVSVTSKGKLTAKKSGQATITATVKVGSLSAKASCKVKVTEPSIKLNKTSLSLKVGETTTLKATTKNTTGKISWKSSKSSVASVSSSGTITAKKAGTATITATINGKTAKCKVTVKKAPVSIKLSSSSLTLKKGDSATLKAIIIGTTKRASWSSSNTEVAIVSGNGIVKAKKNGTAIITATVDGKRATCKLTVKTDYKNAFKSILEGTEYRYNSRFSFDYFYVLDMDYKYPSLFTFYGDEYCNFYNYLDGENCLLMKPIEDTFINKMLESIYSGSIKYNRKYKCIVYQSGTNYFLYKIVNKGSNYPHFALWKSAKKVNSSYYLFTHKETKRSAFNTTYETYTRKSTDEAGYRNFIKTYYSSNDVITCRAVRNNYTNRKKYFG
ncbi:MAG: Ig-like domain-containing protein [Eubacteriales bacterium]|nr:Ig-like domain-containing protein [Eubacteriales bacterium]